MEILVGEASLLQNTGSTKQSLSRLETITVLQKSIV